MAQVAERMREYETIYVLNPEITDSVAKDFMLKMKDLVVKNGGQNVKVDCWGRRRLAWERGKHQRGLYVHHLYLGQPGIVHEYERNLAIDESVILHQSVLVNREVDASARPEQADQFEAPVIRERRDVMPRHGDFDSYDDNMEHGDLEEMMD